MLNSQFWAAIAILSGAAGIVLGILLLSGVIAVKVPLMVIILFWLVWLLLEPKP
jgi:hypothetical protein